MVLSDASCRYGSVLDRRCGDQRNSAVCNHTKHLNKIDLDELVKKTLKRIITFARRKVFRLRRLMRLPEQNVKAIDHPKKGMTEEERKAAMAASTEYYKNADKPGSLASKLRWWQNTTKRQKNKGEWGWNTESIPVRL